MGVGWSSLSATFITQLDAGGSLAGLGNAAPALAKFTENLVDSLAETVMAETALIWPADQLQAALTALPSLLLASLDQVQG